MLAALPGGMWRRFAQVVDDDSWEPELLEESVARQVGGGHLVPITIGFDGAFQMLVRIGVAFSFYARLTHPIRLVDQG